MQNKLLAFLRQYKMVQPGDCVVCAVSGGADSMALLWALYLLQDKLGINLSAAHFNHGLRGEESDGDEAFVRDFCRGYNIPLSVGSAQVLPGKKGLEAAAREARYQFLLRLPGKIATAHTANDNAETVLMHMVRGTGLKGLGAIAPVTDKLIRPMLTITRDEVLAFLEREHIPFREDSSNAENTFFRNRLRHRVMPLLTQENPHLAENLSAMALRLREDEALLSDTAKWQDQTVSELKAMAPARRGRVLRDCLEKWGVREPEAEHVALMESLVFSANPSARACFPAGVTISRCYETLVKLRETAVLPQTPVVCPGVTEIPEAGIRICCTPAAGMVCEKNRFTVVPKGQMYVRSRREGDAMRTSGGTKSLKKLLIDKKIPAAQRLLVPVLCDDAGILGVYGLGPNLDRLSKEEETVEIRMETV